MLLATLSICLLQAWYFEPIPSISQYYVSLDVDSCGVPAIAYWTDSTVYYARRTAMGDSFSWPAESVAVTLFHAFCYSQEFAVGNNSQPHILYHQWHTYPHNLDLYYASKDSTGLWYSTLIDSPATGHDIDTDSSDFPHAIYAGRGLCHKYWDGSNWITEMIDSSYSFLSLKVDKNNNIHIGLGAPIIYNNQRQGYAGYAHKDSSGWHIEYMHQYDVRWPIGIDADDQCNPHLAFDVFYDSCYHLVKRNNQWFVDNLTSYGHYGSLLAVNGATVHLLGLGDSYDLVRHAWKSDSVWLTEDIYQGYPIDYVVDSDGYSHCLIDDNTTVIYGTNRPQVFVSEKAKHILLLPTSGVIGQFPMIVSFPNNALIKKVKVIDICGRTVKDIACLQNKGHAVWDGLDNDNRKIGNGIYFIVVKSDRKTYAQKILVVR